MAFADERLRDLVRRGHFLVAVKEFEASEPGFSNYPEEARALLARCYAQVGKGKVALRILRDSSLPPSPHVGLATGLALKSIGETSQAKHQFESAASTAAASGDSSTAGWANLHAFRLEIHSESLSSPRFASLRQSVIQAADGRLSAALHETIAVIEGQRGHLQAALQHLLVTRSLLQGHPNALVEQQAELTQACIYILMTQAASAERHLEAAMRLDTLTGCAATAAAIEANRAHLSLLRGQFARVTARTPQPTQCPPRAVAGITEGIARAHLAIGDTGAARDSATSVASVVASPASYAARWAGLTLCKALHRERRYDDLLAALAREEENARLAGDRPLLASLLLVRAESSAELGQQEDASRHLFEAAALGISSHPELQGHYQVSVGRILGQDGAGLGTLLTERALRRWRNQRNVLALVETETFGKPALPLADYDRDARFTPRAEAPAPAVPVEERPFAVVESVAQLLSTADSPELIGEELRQLAVQLGVDRHVAISTGKGQKGKSQAQPAGAITVSLDADGQRDVTLSCCPGTDAAANVALAALTTVARSAVNLHRLKADEKDRSALWPISDLDVNGALFVDDQMVTLLGMAKKVAAADVTVLITGETGTGKDVVARAIHAASGRSKHAMVPFNCSSCPREMVDAQLFGHRRGSFTGAVDTATGIIRGVTGGTLFLDEVGDAPLDVQPKLLRFLESNEVHPIGEARPSTVDVRVIAATNVDLQEAVHQGRFREDLFYRLNIVTLQVPPLRERRSEIPVLAAHYLQQAAMAQRKGALRLAEETVEYLLLYRWPGNVRQLANEIRRMAALAERDQVLMPEHLSPVIAASRRTVPPSDRTLDLNEVAVRTDQPLSAATEHLERAMILQAMGACNNRVEDAAKRLGLSRKGLYLKRVRLGLCASESAEAPGDTATEEA